tara:strand:+ start:9420 stop:9941 length:522 start_codon:yes stop_codon:yes gene_type:complete
MRLVLFLSSILYANAYKLLDFYTPIDNPVPFYTCCDLNEKVLYITKNVIEDINNHNIINISLHNEIYKDEIGNANTICSFDDDAKAFGYTMLFRNEADIYISNKLLKTDKTLYNVILHEFIHALGLNHSALPSIMNYTVSISYMGNIYNDRDKLYLSVDDMRGLEKVKKNMDI